MSKETITTYKYGCDVCGAGDQPEKSLVLLAKVRESYVGNLAGTAKYDAPERAAYVCEDCRKRPVSDLLDVLDKMCQPVTRKFAVTG